MTKLKNSQGLPQTVLGVCIAIITVIALTASVLPAKAYSAATSEQKVSKPETTRGLSLKEWHLLAK